MGGEGVAVTVGPLDGPDTTPDTPDETGALMGWLGEGEPLTGDAVCPAEPVRLPPTLTGADAAVAVVTGIGTTI